MLQEANRPPPRSSCDCLKMLSWVGSQAYGAARIRPGFGIADCDGGKKADGDFRHHSCGPRMKMLGSSHEDRASL
jgi:hypothetical protein